MSPCMKLVLLVSGYKAQLLRMEGSCLLLSVYAVELVVMVGGGGGGGTYTCECVCMASRCEKFNLDFV